MKVNYKIWIIIFLFFIIPNYSQIFYGSTGTFAPNTTTFFNLNLSGLSQNTINYNFGLEWVKISLNSNETHNISVLLVAPDNTEVILSHAITWGTSFSNTYFKDHALIFLNESSGSYNNSFRPDENIGVINNGQNPNGQWKLKIVNNNSSSGTLNQWSINFSNTPSVPVLFTSSNLPIVKINTNGQLIYDEPKIAAQLEIIDNVSGVNNYTDTPTFTSNIGIEFRGQSSQGVVKKSFAITTTDANGLDTDVSIFGMPAEEDWVLIANYNDKSLMRNALAYELARQTGRYAARTHFCEVFINNQYRGVYHFGEKIKRDNNRVDIAKLEPNEISGVNLTGGYIIKIDKQNGWEPGFTSPYQPINHPNGQYIKYLYEYPDPDEIVNEQRNYIESYVVANFENTLNSSNFSDPILGFRPYADEQSFMDFFFINEIGKNVDGYRISTYLHKDKNGELVMGPVWDFDLAFRNADYCEGQNYTGWAFQFPCTYDSYQPPFWWEKLFQDDVYCHDMRERWLQYRQNIFSDTNVINLIDGMANELNIAQSRNFQKWNTMGRYIWPNPSPLATSHSQEVTNMKEWILNRLEWIDNNLPNPSLASHEDQTDSYGIFIANPITDDQIDIYLYEKPFSAWINIFDLNGKKVFEDNFHLENGYNSLKTPQLNKGIYLIIIQSEEKVINKKLIVK